MCTYDEEAKVVLDRLGLKLEYGAARSCQINSVDACFGLTLLPVESQMTVFFTAWSKGLSRYQLVFYRKVALKF